MGWSWRKSTSVGPFKFNFSQLGVGVSAGVKGARLSIGSKGIFVHVGTGGFRYSSRLEGRGSAPTRLPSHKQNSSQMKDRYRTIENLNPSFLVQVNADNVLDEIRNNAHQTSLLSRLLVLCGLLFTVSLYLILPPTSREHVLVAQAFGLLGLLVLVGLPWANQKDEKRLTTNITYQFDEMGEQVVEAIKRLVRQNIHMVIGSTTQALKHQLIANR